MTMLATTVKIYFLPCKQKIYFKCSLTVQILQFGNYSTRLQVF